MDSDRPSRNQLIALARQIQDAQDRGENASNLLSQLQASVPYPNVAELFAGDNSAEYIVDYSLQWKEHWPKLPRKEMADLVSKIVNAEGTEADLAIMIAQFKANCVHPGKSDLIYYPEGHFAGNSNPSVAQIVDKALSDE
jgi:hypothetical protein